jgi:excisionase family DNA binding protein
VFAPYGPILTVDKLHTFAQDRRNMVEYLRPREVCERLGIGRTTFVRWVKQGKIRVSRPTLRTTYVSTAELARFYNANAQPVPGANNRAAA